MSYNHTILREYKEKWRGYKEKYKTDHGISTVYINHIIEKEYDVERSIYKTLLSPLLTNYMTTEQLKLSKYFIYNIMNCLNNYSKFIEDYTLNKPSILRTMTKKKVSNIPIIEIPSARTLKNKIKNIENLIDEINFYIFEEDTYKEFNHKTLTEELERYKTFLLAETEKDTFIENNKYKNELKYIINNKFEKLGITNYKKELDNLIKNLTLGLFEEINITLARIDKYKTVSRQTVDDESNITYTVESIKK